MPYAPGPVEATLIARLPRPLTLSLLITLLGCGSARLVQRTETGGTLALEGQRSEAMKQARQMMLEHCRGDYQIVEQEQAEGEDAEWRLRYVCGHQKQ